MQGRWMFRNGYLCAIRRLRLLAAAAILSVASSCALVATGEGVYPVEWDASLSPAANDKATTRAELKQAMSQAWFNTFRVVPYAGSAEAAEPIQIRTCEEYFDLADRDVRPVTGGSSTRLIFKSQLAACHEAQLVLSARPAGVSHLHELAFDKNLPSKLPWHIAPIISSSRRERIAAGRPDARWADIETAPKRWAGSCGADCAEFENASSVLTVFLKARGDFNADGVEDLLVGTSVSLAKGGGSYRARRSLILTRLHAGAAIKLVRELEY